MTREEIDRHVAGILDLRRRRKISASVRARYARGFDTSGDFNPSRRHARPISRNTLEQDVAAVDQVFTARGRAGWLPRGGDE